MMFRVMFDGTPISRVTMHGTCESCGHKSQVPPIRHELAWTVYSHCKSPDAASLKSVLPFLRQNTRDAADRTGSLNRPGDVSCDELGGRTCASS